VRLEIESRAATNRARIGTQFFPASGATSSEPFFERTGERGLVNGPSLGTRPRWAGAGQEPKLETAIREALRQPGRTEGVRKIAERFGVNPGTVQRISRPFEGAGVAV
jgi:hypothetical protein